MTAGSRCASCDEHGREAEETDDPAGADVVLDALFGTGFHGEPRPEAAALIERVNASGARVLAVDVPSGVDASSGVIAGEAVRADATVTFHGRKVGLDVAPGRDLAGTVTVAEIGLAASETAHRLVRPEILRLVPRRAPGDNKYTAGSVLVVGGSPGLTGAACLTAEAAFRADAGYVAVAAPAEALPVLEQRAARGRQASARRRLRGRRARRRARARAGARRGARRSSSRGSSPRPTCRPSSTRTRCASSSRSSGTPRPC